MKLKDVVENIGEIDETLIIFQEDGESYDADVILSSGEEGEESIRVENGKKYYYLIEVSLAQEFVDDWKLSLSYSPSLDETVKRLYDYAINDA